jgi:predicted RNA polymerase sigma factor
MPNDVLEEIERLVAQGFLNRAAVYETIYDIMQDQVGIEALDFEQVGRPALQAAIEDAFCAKKQAQQSWPAVTDCDRLTQVFEQLTGRGILAIENCGLTVQEGDDLAGASVANLNAGEPGQFHGYCF